MSIENHEFQDSDVESATLLQGDIVGVDINGYDKAYIIFDREDIIALAKAIELTGEDLE